MTKRLIFAVLFLSVSAFAQGSWFQGTATTTNGASSLPTMLVVPNSSVTVCTAPATGGTNTTPCTNKVPLCTDQTLGSCSTSFNPVIADGAGNFGFWVTPGTYDVDVCSPAPTSCFIYAHQTLAAPGGGPGIFNGLTVTAGGLNRLIVDNSNYVSVFSRIQPIQPDPLGLFPLGNDLSLECSGSADCHYKNNPLHITATTSLGIGANPSVIVSASGGLSHATNVTLVIEPGTANEEIVLLANWSCTLIPATSMCAAGSTLSITAAKNHTQPYTISQQGSQFWAENSHNIEIVGDPLYLFTTFLDNHGNDLYAIPTNQSTWPNAGSIRFDQPFQGGNGTNLDTVDRLNNSLSKRIRLNATGSTIYTQDNSGNVSLPLANSQLAVGKATAANVVDIQGPATGAAFECILLGDSPANRVNLCYSTSPIAGTKLVPAQINALSTILEIGGRGNQPSTIELETSPDAGTTGLVERLRVTSDGATGLKEVAAPASLSGFSNLYADSTAHQLKLSNNAGSYFQVAQVITATSAAFATATTAGTCVQSTTAVTGATTAMAVSISPVSTPGVGSQWSAFVSSAGNVTINECAVAVSAGGTIAFNIRVLP